MDNKKLMHILLNDIVDLQELISEMKTAGSCDSFDLELLHTRISGIRHMLEVVSRTSDSRLAASAEQTVVRQMPADNHFVPQTGEKPDPARVIPDISEPVPATGKPEEAESKREEKQMQPEPEDEQPEAVVPQLEDTAETEPYAGDENDDVELEEIAKSEKQTIGEKFVQGRSVNDILLEQGKPDTKFSNMPVSSLKAAIGINDRFLFTRELFDGDGKAFAEVITKIDGMANIHEAAVYLRENYKWKKNDTSLKFIDLVKRRFI